MTPTQRTLERIDKLRDPATLDKLLDAFQELGLPMGNDRWAEHCHALLLQRAQESATLNRVLHHLDLAQSEVGRGTAWFWRDQQTKLVKEYRDEQRKREEADGQET